jgi:N-methylhydantoinase A/oxoprolinase/acetone carboxylase beta subunit
MEEGTADAIEDNRDNNSALGVSDMNSYSSSIHEDEIARLEEEMGEDVSTASHYELLKQIQGLFLVMNIFF